MSVQSYDAIVIGGGTSGLVAGSYLAKAGKKVVLFEAREDLGGLCTSAVSAEKPLLTTGAQTLYALDPLVASELRLSKNGLHLSGRELALTGLRRDGKHIVISRDVHDTVSSIARHSQRDAEAWPRFRKELFELGRAMRPFWWEACGQMPSGDAGQKMVRIGRMGAGAWLDSWFENDALKATLCFDSTAGGVSILEPGSALSLIWRAAQEMSGLQGAVAIPERGLNSLAEALTLAAQRAGCEIRTRTPVNRVILDGDRVAGVQIESGETCMAPSVFSATGSFYGVSKLLPPMALGIAGTSALPQSPLLEARVEIKLRKELKIGAKATLPASRFILAETSETYAAAEMSARKGDLADELPIEFVSAADLDASGTSPGPYSLSALVRPVPRYPNKDWGAFSIELGARVVRAIEELVPGFSHDVVQTEVLRPDQGESPSALSASRMLMTAAGRIETPISGLYYCGGEAEPVPAVSGRAARLAVGLAMAMRP